MTEKQLIDLLEQFSGGEGEASGKSTRGVVIQRRKYGFDDDNDDDNDDDLA